jgi:thioredoxin reductase (NADPH)
MFHRVSDYPGLVTQNGRELRDHFAGQLADLKQAWRVGVKIEMIDLKSRRLSYGGESLESNAIIIATGARKRKLGVPGEDEFETRGISYSATRDHSQYAGKKVCVIGGGDSAIENSLILARVCPEVTIIHRSDKFRARAEWLKEVRENPKISLIAYAAVKAFQGDDRLKHLVIEDLRTGKERTIETEGAFVKVGIAPNTEPFRNQLELDEEGYIKVDRRQRTSQPLVYAAGDVCRPVCLSVATAVGHGAIAAKDAGKQIKKEDAGCWMLDAGC